MPRPFVVLVLLLALAPVAAEAQSKYLEKQRTVPAGRAPRIADDHCDLAQTLRRYAAAEIGFARKFRTGDFFVAPEEWRGVAGQMVSIDDIMAHLRSLSSFTPTEALVYDTRDRGRHLCTWMIGATGLLASSDELLDTEFMADQFRWALRVEAIGPQRRLSDGTCAPLPLPPALRLGPRPSVDALSRKFLSPPIADAILVRASRDRPKRFLILAPADLSTIPFAALRVGENDLIDVAAPVMLADVAQLFVTSSQERDPMSGKKLVVGNPDLSGDQSFCWGDLPGAADEAMRVADLVDTRALLGPEATRGTVLDSLRANDDHSLIYLATHGSSNSVDPMDASFLALAEGHLFARDIKGIKLPGRPLVVMSACQTGLGKNFEGGVFGLARAWHHAGAPRVVMSLWNIDDDATKRLMLQFVQRLRAGEPAEHALRLAMLCEREKITGASPDFWAGFAVYGQPTREQGSSTSPQACLPVNP